MKRTLSAEGTRSGTRTRGPSLRPGPSRVAVRSARADSFAGRLIPYLSEHFGRASYLWQNEFDFDEIDRDHPDIVVQEFVARHFFAYVPYPGIIPH